jgi:hypothetical protein
MRSHAAALIASIVLAVPLTAGAAETWTCWSAIDDRGDDGSVQATRCRLAGETGTVDYGSVSEVPVVLAPQVGTDGDGVCWYWTTRASAWVLLGVDDHGNATMGIDPDGVVGGPVIIDAIYPRCTSEPTEAANALMEAYALLSRYDHPAPTASVDPPPGSGIVGMDVFITDSPPQPWSDSLVSPHSGRTIEVETFVDAVEIDWGNGSTTVVPQAAFGLLTGWPDGGFSHLYEVKTCASPGGPRCHPSLDSYELVVSYRWVARYRVDGGEWDPIPVPPTTTTVAYDVDEIVSVTTAVG